MVATPPFVDPPSFLADEHPGVQTAAPDQSNFEGSPSADFPVDNSNGNVTILEELAPLPPAAGGEDSSGSTELDSRGGSLIAEETTDSGSWLPADQAAGSTSGDTDVAEVEDAQQVGEIVSTARSTRLSSSGTDEEDPPQGHKS
jgi:hypothetical protein